MWTLDRIVAEAVRLIVEIRDRREELLADQPLVMALGAMAMLGVLMMGQ